MGSLDGGTTAARSKAVRGGASLLVLAGLAGAWHVVQTRNGNKESDVIIEMRPDLGGHPWLKANLEGADVVCPDRPHAMQEVRAHHEGGQTPFARKRSYELRTNSLGLRGPELGDDDPSVLRLLAIGDSVTHGWGVAEHESYPSVLEDLLRNEGHAVQVINAGVPANQIPTMLAWCQNVAPSLGIDVLLWTRRPSGFDQAPYPEYRDALLACADALDAEAVAVLPPISTFDLRGSHVWEQEYRALDRELRARGVTVVELTPAFRAGQQGRGEILVEQENQVQVVDQETGEVWLTAPPVAPDLHPSIYELFENEPEVREALFFDSGHPDAEGLALFAREVADAVIPML